MGLKALAACFGALVIAITAVAVPSAEAQTETVAARKKRLAAERARTRVVVQPRSFLDAGTNVVPGERKFTDYVFPPGYGPGSVPGGAVTTYGNGVPGSYNWPSYNSWGPGFSGW
jgi:hypothetical protein